MRVPTLPPLLDGARCPPGGELLDRAADGAASGEHEAGAFLHRISDDRIACALVLEPEVERERAAQMLPLVQVATGEALSVLAPPDTRVEYLWAGEIALNGAACGGVRGRMADNDGDVPDWLALEVRLRRTAAGEPGHDMARTSLMDELGPSIDAIELVESMARHLVLWLHRWGDEGFAPLARKWSKQVAGTGERFETEEISGTLLGVDDEGAALVRMADRTLAVPLTRVWR